MIELVATAVAKIILPLAFVHATVLIDEHSKSLALSLYNGALIEGVLCSLKTKLFGIT